MEDGMNVTAAIRLSVASKGNDPSGLTASEQTDSLRVNQRMSLQHLAGGKNIVGDQPKLLSCLNLILLRSSSCTLCLLSVSFVLNKLINTENTKGRHREHKVETPTEFGITQETTYVHRFKPVR